MLLGSQGGWVRRAVVIAAGVLVTGGCSVTSEPLLTVSPMFVDVGTVTQGQVIRELVNIHNGGDDKVDLRVSSSCACSDITTASASVGPGGVVQATVTVDTTLKGPGTFRQKVQVGTEDLSKRPLTVTVVGVVRPEFTMSALQIDLGEVPAAVTGGGSVDIIASEGSDFTILKAVSTDPRLVATLAINGKSKRAIRLIVRQIPRAERGRYMATIVLYTTSRMTPRLFVPVRGKVV